MHHLIVRGQYHGTLAIPPRIQFWGGKCDATQSYAYICPTCLSVWATIATDPADAHVVLPVRCAKHPNDHAAGNLIPFASCGYGLIPRDEAFLWNILGQLPAELLRAELVAHCDYHLRRLTEND